MKLPSIFLSCATLALSAVVPMAEAADTMPAFDVRQLRAGPMHNLPPGSNCGIPGFEARLLDLVNRMRAVGAHCGSAGSFSATGPLRWNQQLTVAARWHTAEMAETNHFHHTSQRDGRTVAQRIAAAGYAWGEFGENIAAGGSSPEEIIARWHRSPRHCANLMNPYFTDVGAACQPAVRPGRFLSFWTMDLAGP